MDKARERFKQSVWGRISRRLPGYDHRNWLRIRQIEAFEKFLIEHPGSSVLEISPGWNSYWSRYCATYKAFDYPDFDICRDRLDERFDIVIADQVLEHVAKPAVAVSNIHSMVRPGGYALVATPFLFRVHPRPQDFSRWTEDGLKELLTGAGFSSVQTASWGNRWCARAHIGGPVRDYGYWRPLKNDPEYALQVWAFARA